MSPRPHPLPEALRGVFPPYRWSVQKLWALDAPSCRVPTEELWWLLELPVWPTAPPDKIFDLSPASVLEHPERFPERMSRILRADLEFPLELYEYNGRFVLIDGYHRLARMRLEGNAMAVARRHASSIMGHIARD